MGNNKKKKKRICLIYYTIFDGSALLWREAKCFKDKGYSVDIICLRQNHKEKIFQKFDGLNLYCIQSRPAREKKAILYFLRLMFFILNTALFLTFSIFTRRYQVVQVTAPPDFLVFSAIIPKLFGSKIILDIHDIGPELFRQKLHLGEKSLLYKMLLVLEKKACQFSDHVITVTEQWREKLISRSLTELKSSVLLNVPDDNLFKRISYIDENSKHDERGNRNSCNIYYHGSFEEHFGLDTLIEAMPAVKKNVPNVKLYLYGRGRQEAVLKDLVKKLDLNSSVSFEGTVPFYELPIILKNADLGVVPTKNTFFSGDTISMKSLEYISLGIPIVISKTRAHAYYFDETMVKFFDPDNPSSLAESLICLCNDKSSRQMLSDNSQKFISKHGWAKAKERYYKSIEDLFHSET